MQVSKRIEMDNVVRISSKKDIDAYAYTILLRMQPDPYLKYGCIKLRFTKDLFNHVRWLCMLFGNAGIMTKSVYKIDKLEFGRGVILDNVYEAELRKIGALDFDKGEFEEETKHIWDKALEG